MGTKYTETEIIEGGSYTLNKGDSIVINETAKEEIEQGANVAAIQSDLEQIPATETVTLNGDISVTDKADDASDESTHKTFGLDLHATASTTIRTDNAAKINVTRENLTKMGEAVAYGIANLNGLKGTNTGALVFNGDFLDAITVSATNSYKEGIANTTAAYGIFVADDITFDGAINAAIKATSTAKTNGSSAYGIYMGKSQKALTLKDDILKDISATATGNGGQAQAYAIKSDGTLAIGAEGIGNDADIAGKITATATGTAALNADGTARIANAKAYAVYGSNITMYGNITKNITATATANSVKLGNKTVSSGTANAYGLYSYSELIINGAVSAAIKATATAKAKDANATGIYGRSKVTITDGITKDITVTATGAAMATMNSSSSAYAINSDLEVTIGTAGTTENAIAGKLTAKATGNATLNTDKSKGYTGNAKAYGIYGQVAVTINGDITKDITATATANSVKQSNGITVSGTAKAYGINNDSEQKLSINGAVSGAIKATATAKANQANANGIFGNSITITDGITKDISATTTGAANLSAAKEESFPTMNSADAIATSGDLTIGTAGVTKNAIAGKLTAKATGNAALNADKSKGYAGNAEASGLRCYSITTINGNIAKDISATATANSVKQSDGIAVSGTADATGIGSSSGVTITGAVSAAIKATATSKANQASAIGISSDDKISITNGITKDISATATGAATATSEVTIYAYAISAYSNLTIGTADTTENAIAGKLTVKATGNAALNADKSKGYAGNVEAIGLYSKDKNAVTIIHGDITKDISATATANSVKQSDGTVVSGTANAYGLYTMGNLTIGNIKGKITVNATSKTNSVQAIAIFVPSRTLTLDSSLGTITATATGVGGAARAVVTNGIVHTGDVLTGKITATYKTGSATGMQVQHILHSTGDTTEAGTATLTITVTAKKATGIYLSYNTGGQLTLSATKITAKTTDKTNGTARAIASESMSVQDIALTDKTVLTGSVELGMGEDILTLKGLSKITGDVDLGDDDDIINIYTGSQIKGDVENVEKCSFTFDTLKYASTALWEGTEFSCKESGMSIEFSEDVINELKAGKKKTFTLLKDTDGNVWGSEGTEKISLNVAGATGVTNVGSDIPLGDCIINIHTDAKGKTLLCDITKQA